jgi:hypothetical protein
MVCWVEVVAGIVEMGRCRVGMLVVLVGCWCIFVASMDLVLDPDHQNWDLRVFAGMQCVREELPSDPRV